MSVPTTLTSIEILSVFPVAHSPLGCLISYRGAQGENGQLDRGRRAQQCSLAAHPRCRWHVAKEAAHYTSNVVPAI